MALQEEIRENLASGVTGARKLTLIDDQYPAWTFREEERFGVAVLANRDAVIAENFSSCHLRTHIMNIDHSGDKLYLVLFCEDETLRYAFASVCAEFVDPGENGERRQALLSDPFEWWNEWCSLLGNAMRESKPYSVLGEMMALYAIKRETPEMKIVWEATHGGTHDIESPNASYEVKSTLQKYKALVDINSQYQMYGNEKPLYLYFIRLERSVQGVCINDMVERLIEIGYDRLLLERQLTSMGYEKGTQRRFETYISREQRKYAIDGTFPKIVADDFKGDKIPDNIVKITYTIDLEGIAYTDW